MKKKFFQVVAITIAVSFANLAFAAPHWNHEEQATWWEIEDTSKDLPMKYPFATCGVGQHQSPIDLATAKFDNTKKLNKLQASYPIDPAPVFFNSGHGIQVNTSNDYKGEIKIGEESYPLIQFHFHEPSEHVINGKPFAAELHYVHVGNDGRIIVVGAAIDIGAENPTFQIVLDNMPHEHASQKTDANITINPASLLPASLDSNDLDFYSLVGSLTTPPCSEGVQWYLLSQVITISAAQLEQLKGFYSDNARSPQNVNGRVLSATH